MTKNPSLIRLIIRFSTAFSFFLAQAVVPAQATNPTFVESFATYAKGQKNIADLVTSLKLTSNWETQFFRFLAKNDLGHLPVPEVMGKGNLLTIDDRAGQQLKIDFSQIESKTFSVNGKRVRMESTWTVERLVSVIEKLAQDSRSSGWLRLGLPEAQASSLVAAAVIGAIGLAFYLSGAWESLFNIHAERAKKIREAYDKSGIHLQAIQCTGEVKAYSKESKVDSATLKISYDAGGGEKTIIFFPPDPAQKPQSRSVVISANDFKCGYSFSEKGSYFDAKTSLQANREICNRIATDESVKNLDLFKNRVSTDEWLECARIKKCCETLNQFNDSFSRENNYGGRDTGGVK